MRTKKFIHTSFSEVPRRVQFEIKRQIESVLYPLYIAIVNERKLPIGRACHAKAFTYLVKHKNNQLLRQVLLYKSYANSNNDGILAHSVVCEGNKIVYDSEWKSPPLKHIYLNNDEYYYEAYDTILNVGAALTLKQLLFLFPKDNKMISISKRELSKLQQAYRDLFNSCLAEYNVKSPFKLNKEQRSEFFKKVKEKWSVEKSKIK